MKNVFFEVLMGIAAIVAAIGLFNLACTATA